ncbi:ATP-binding cassette domain-containing protein [Thermodesulfobacteriota bacterium]
MRISVENLHYTYNKGTPLEIEALKGIDFELEHGMTLGILGGTGSGKTTLIKTLNGLLLPTKGRVSVNGTDTRDFGPDLRRRVGLVLQRPERQLFEETVYRDISYVLRRFADLSHDEIKARVGEVCLLLGLDLDKLAERVPTALSEGEKRKVAIAGVLANKPETLILDEPAVGLDPPAMVDLTETLLKLKASGTVTIVIVSHDMERFLPLLDLIMILDNGRVTGLGPPAETCLALAGDPEMRRVLPGLVLLVHGLREAGYDIDPKTLDPSLIADQIIEANS